MTLTAQKLDELEAGIVLPLEWERYGLRWRAPTPFGPYMIARHSDRQWWFYRNNQPDAKAGFETPEMAKAAAQADYAKRILSCLNPSLIELARIGLKHKEQGNG